MRELLSRIEEAKEKGPWVIMTTTVGEYITDEYSLDTTKRLSKAKKFKRIPDEIGEEPYPNELNRDGTAYENMSGAKTHFPKRYDVELEWAKREKRM